MSQVMALLCPEVVSLRDMAADMSRALRPAAPAHRQDLRGGGVGATLSQLYPHARSRYFGSEDSQVPTVHLPGAQTSWREGTWLDPDLPWGMLSLKQGNFWEMPLTSSCIHE